MQAAVFRGAGMPLRVEAWPDPEPGPGQLLVRVAACGVCHTDLHYLDHGVPTFRPPPLVLGHEASGRVAGLGPGVEGWEVGQPVLLPAVFSCGGCRACREGRENLCQNQLMLGNSIDGAYAEWVAVPARDVQPLPPEIPLEEASIIADALTTPYHAVVHRGRVRPGQRVLIVGCGGVGLNLVQFAHLAGAHVMALDLLPWKLELARSLGADQVLNPAGTDRPDREVRSWSDGGVDVAMEAIGKPETQELALSCLRPGGRLVLVGYSSLPLPLNAGRVMYRELDVLGSLGCRPVDYGRVIELVRQGRVELKPLISHRFPLEEIDRALEALRSGQALRSIVIPDGAAA